MRSLPIQSGMIRIASVSGKRRDVPVSGFCKARLLWLFRNYHILDFPVLTPNQQQLIAEMWNSVPASDPKEVVATKNDPTHAVLKAVDPSADDWAGPAANLSSLDLIGTVEGFLPQLYAHAQFRVGDPIQSPAVAHPYRLRLHLPESMRIRVIWSAGAAMAVLLLAAVFALGPMTPGPGTPGSAAPGAKTLAPKVAPLPAVAAADPKPVRPAPPGLDHPAAKPSPAVVAEGAPDLPHSADVGPPPHPLPSAMALNVSAPEVTPPPTRPTLHAKPPAIASATSSANRPTHPFANREVMIRVSVDRQGRTQEVEILQGHSKKTSAALHAARRFAFEPCNRSFDCDHLLKFTDYGDASIVQKID